MALYQFKSDSPEVPATGDLGCQHGGRGLSVSAIQTKAPAITDVSSPRLTGFSFNGSVLLQKCGLHISNGISFRNWEVIGRQLLAVADSSTWWIADWLVYGETSFQERYPEAIRATSLNYQTLRNYAWVARRFAPSRRRDSISFGHHAEVAALDESEQDYWLRKAEELGWSRNQLRREVRISLLERRANPDEAPHYGSAHSSKEMAGEDELSSIGAEAITLKVTSDQLEHFATAARCLNLTLDKWAIQVLDAAVADIP
jgi:hypothetical protein